ncbi:TPA: prepilin-type N-terminal cleavage/methylation domain-containing protein, partial [Vibrio parahaemolyticus]|nr:prepilin-type N-terminal cleavage/methylation domain-containing protein [Vibrio parahaemolyticus]
MKRQGGFTLIELVV